MVDVIGIGASSIDFVYLLPAAPQPDSPASKLRISGHLVSPGGQTATVLCTCAALGLRTKYVGTLGSDAHAQTLLSTLRAHGVDTTGAIVRPVPSPYAVILIDTRRGERMVLWDRHPDAILRPEDVCDVDLTSARILFVDDVDEDAAIGAAERARAAGVRVVNDIEQTTAGTRRLVDASDCAIFAEHVPQALAPASTPVAALQTLRGRADQWLAVTMGARGAILLAGGEMYSVAGHAVHVVDTTGAGDVFRGAFIAALLRGDPPGDVLAFANAAAALGCTALGAIASVPAESAVRRLLAR